MLDGILLCTGIEPDILCAGQGAGGRGSLDPRLRPAVGGGLRTARGTAGNESRVTPLCSSSAKIGPPTGNCAVPATALIASVNWVRTHLIHSL